MCVCVCQAVNGELVPFLLELLESPLTECDKPSATKALIAESLKAMAQDLANGEKVSGWGKSLSRWESPLMEGMDGKVPLLERGPYEGRGKSLSGWGVPL